MYRFLAILIGSAAFWWASGDWSCVLVFVIPACAVIDYFLEPVICGLSHKTTRRRNVIRLTVIAVLGLVTGHSLRITPRWAFQEALKIDPPPGVEVQEIHRHYEGGPGEHTLIVEFKADKQVVDSILKVEPLAQDGATVERWRQAGGDWPAATELVGEMSSFQFSKWSWWRIRPMNQPLMYDFNFGRLMGRNGFNYHGDALLLWEAQTQRGVLVQRRF